MPVISASEMAGRPKNSRVLSDQGSAKTAKLDRYGVPIPLTAMNSLRAAEAPVQFASATAKLSDSAETTFEPDKSSGSLIDIDLPAPSAPQSLPTQEVAEDGGPLKFSLEDGPQAIRGPELVERDQPVRIEFSSRPSPQSEPRVSLELKPIAPLSIDIQPVEEDSATEHALSDLDAPTPISISSEAAGAQVDPSSLVSSRPIRKIELAPTGDNTPTAVPESSAIRAVPEQAVVSSHLSDSAPQRLQTAAMPQPLRQDALAVRPMPASPMALSEVTTPGVSPAAHQQQSPRPIGSLTTLPDASSPTAVPDLFEGMEVTEGKAIQLNLSDPQSIAWGEQYVEYSVEDPSICKILPTGSKALSVIGLKAGTTRIAFVKKDAAGNPQIEIHQAEVAPANIARSTQQELARELTATISQMYKTNKVRVRSTGDQLVVEGTAATEKDALKIINMVRKTTLLPVVDHLKAYYK